VDKYFQLEELEDKEDCTTEVFLRHDNTAVVGETTGPIFVSASGTWEQKLNGTFRMVIKRTYDAGRERHASTDMGRFQFEVERSYVGEITKVGASAAVAGTMHHLSEFGDQQVGYFNLIDTSSARVGENKSYSMRSY